MPDTTDGDLAKYPNALCFEEQHKATKLCRVWLCVQCFGRADLQATQLGERRAAGEVSTSQMRNTLRFVPQNATRQRCTMQTTCTHQTEPSYNPTPCTLCHVQKWMTSLLLCAAAK